MQLVLRNMVAAGLFALALATACYAGVRLGTATPAHGTAAPADPPAAAAAVPIAPAPPAATPATLPALPEPVPGGLVGAARARFIDSGMARCVPTETDANRGAASPAQVERYCGCYVERLADSLSSEDFMEVYNAVSTGTKPSPRITRTMSASARLCWAATMPRP